MNIHTGQIRVSALGIYGYGGRTTEERVQFYYKALLRPPMETLLYYVNNQYRGWDVSAGSVVSFYKSHPRARDPVCISSTMKDRPADRSRVGPRGVLAPPTITGTASSGGRWGQVFGREVHVDELGEFLPTAYAWVTKAMMAYDASHSPGY